MTKASGPERQDSASGATMRLERLAKRATLALVWERAWPPLASAGAIVALFLGLSWAGIWFVLPTYARLAALAAFAVGAVVALFPLARIRLPSHSEALERLDRDAPIRHRPASGFEDRLANDGGDPETRALWEAHRARLAEEVNRLRSRAALAAHGHGAIPARCVSRRCIIAVAGFLAAGPERYARLVAAFDWRGVGAAAVAARVDAWIDPPAYANKPPMILAVAHQSGRETVTTPGGFESSCCAPKARSFDGAVEGALAPAEPATKPADRRRAPLRCSRRRRLQGHARQRRHRLVCDPLAGERQADHRARRSAEAQPKRLARAALPHRRRRRRDQRSRRVRRPGRRE